MPNIHDTLHCEECCGDMWGEKIAKDMVRFTCIDCGEWSDYWFDEEGELINP